MQVKINHSLEFSQEYFLENLRAHLDSMYKLLRPDDRLTLVSKKYLIDEFFQDFHSLDGPIRKWISKSVSIPSHCYMCWTTRNRRVNILKRKKTNLD